MPIVKPTLWLAGLGMMMLAQFVMWSKNKVCSWNSLVYRFRTLKQHNRYMWWCALYITFLVIYVLSMDEIKLIHLNTHCVCFYKSWLQPIWNCWGSISISLANRNACGPQLPSYRGREPCKDVTLCFSWMYFPSSFTMSYAG